jgi:hypothetical protein
LDLEATGADTIELNLCHSLQPARAGLASGALDNTRSGIVGVALLRAGTILGLIAPTELIASNRTPLRAATRLLEESGLDAEAVAAGEVTVATFSAEQYLLDLAPARPQLRPLYRGARPLDLSGHGHHLPRPHRRARR